MTRKKAPATVHGILPVDKPQGWTSHDVVARLRRVTGQKQVGHAGTLDPLATGLLLVVLGHATRLSSYLMASEKVYDAEVMLGATTNTDDAEGVILEERTVPPLSQDVVASCLRTFIGEIEQVPPVYAAVKQGGQRLYKLARQGIDVIPEPRHVTIHAIEIEGFESPRLTLRVRCGSGTYIRALARDIGAALGCGAHLTALRRVSSGSFEVTEAIDMEDLTLDGVRGALLPMDRAVMHLPEVRVGLEEAGAVAQGRAVGAPEVALGDAGAGTVRLYGPTGALLALGEWDGRVVRPVRVFVGETPIADGS